MRNYSYPCHILSIFIAISEDQFVGYLIPSIFSYCVYFKPFIIFLRNLTVKPEIIRNYSYPCHILSIFIAISEDQFLGYLIPSIFSYCASFFSLLSYSYETFVPVHLIPTQNDVKYLELGMGMNNFVLTVDSYRLGI